MNEKPTALPGAAGSNGNDTAAPSAGFGLPAPMVGDEVLFDSTGLKAGVHFPVDWLLWRELKTLEQCLADHAEGHLEALKTRRRETDQSEGLARGIITRMESVLGQLPAALPLIRA